MSSAEVLESPKEFAEGVIPLLKEYTQKLAEITKAAREIWQDAAANPDRNKRDSMRSVKQADAWRLFHQQSNLSPAVHELARRVSQMLEHANLEPLHAVELRLRLAELEHELRASQEMIISATSAF